MKGGFKGAWERVEEMLEPADKREVANMTKSLAIMLRSGVTTVDALDILAEQHTGRVKSAVKHMAEQVRSGETFAEAAEKEKNIFDKVFIGSVRIGENSGTLAENLEHLYTQMDRSLMIRQQVISAMIYPAIVVSLIMVVGFCIAIFVLPQMAQTFAALKTELPWSTRMIMGFADFSKKYGLIVYPFFFLFCIVCVLFLKQKFVHRFTHPFILRIPFLFSFSRELNNARFCRSLGTLLENGVPIREAMLLTGTLMPNVVFGKQVFYMSQEVESGKLLSESLRKYHRLFPAMIASMVAVGERSGGVGKMLLYLADYFENRVDVKFKNSSSLIEPALLILVGIAVAFVAFSILSPIYDITSSLSG